MQEDRKHVVTYRLDVAHTVSVGVLAPDRDAALAIAQESLCLGTLWDGSPQMPILYDEHEEISNGHIEWEAREVEAFPPQDPSAATQAAREKAFDACRALLAAYGGLRPGGGPDGWEVLGEAVETAGEALALLGWRIPAEPPPGSVPPELSLATMA